MLGAVQDAAGVVPKLLADPGVVAGCGGDGQQQGMPALLSRLAALQTPPTTDLKQQWRELFGKEPPPFNRPYLVSRLSYRVQELAYGGLKPEMRARLEALGEQLDGGN